MQNLKVSVNGKTEKDIINELQKLGIKYEYRTICKTTNEILLWHCSGNWRSLPEHIRYNEKPPEKYDTIDLAEIERYLITSFQERVEFYLNFLPNN